jgi:hypothetical protein
LTQDEFETLAAGMQPTFNFHNKINWYSFSLRGESLFPFYFNLDFLL